MATEQDIHSVENSNEKDKTEKASIQIHNANPNESMTIADATENTEKTQFEKKLWEVYGLDPHYWLDILKRQLGFTSSVHLKYLKSRDLKKFESSIMNDYERDAFELIIKENIKKNETEKASIQIHNPNPNESMTLADDTENTEKTQFEKRLWEDYGLDPHYWLDILKRQLGFTSSVHLKYLKSRDLKKFESSIMNDYERDAFELIIKENIKKDDTTHVKEVLDELPINKSNLEGIVQNQLSSLTPTLESGESWKAARHDCNLDNKLKNLQSSNSSNGITRTTLNDKDIISHASSGCALRGIFLNQSLDEVTEMKGIVISVVGDITLQGPSMKQAAEFVEFSSRKKSDDYQKSLQITGKKTKVCANVGLSIFGVKAKGSDTSTKDVEGTNITNSQEFFQSREKHAFVPVKSCELKLENIRLETDAVKSLQNIETKLRAGESCFNILSQCKTFFQNFGSHINTGILHFGGIFKWTATYICLTKSTSESNKDLVHDTLDGFINIGYAGPCPAVGIGISGKSLVNNSSITNKHSEDELSRVQLNIDSIGGPPDESEYHKWVHTLTAENKTWSLISRGNFVGIWEVLKNHQDDFWDVCKLTNLLECCWNMEIVESSHDQFKSADYELLLLTLRKTLDNLIDITGDIDYFERVVETNVKIQTFLEQIAFSKELQNQMQTAMMQNEIFLLLYRVKKAFLKDKPKLMSWISEVNKRFEDLPSALSTEQIDSLSMFMCVLKSKFLPQIKDIFLVERHRSQPKAEHYITTEMTTACHQILADLRKQNIDEFVILLSLLSKLQFDEKRGFRKCLTVADIESFILESEQTIDGFYSLPIKSNVQRQANLVHFVVKTIRESTSKSLDKIFNNCIHALKTDLESDVVSIIERHTKHSPYNWVQMQDDLRPFIDGIETHGQMLTLPDLNIALVEQNQNEKSTLSTSTVPDRVVIFLKEMTIESKVSLLDSITIHTRATDKKKHNLLWFLFQSIMTQHSSFYEILKEHVKNFQDKKKVIITDDFNILDEIEENGSLNQIDNEHSFVDINPLDLVVALFLCSSETLKQALASKMHTCRLAVPFVLPDKCSSTVSVSLLKSILLTHGGNQYTPADDCLCNILSFIRFGCRNISKSGIINDIISNEHHDVFLNRSSPFGTVERKFSEGLVETTFFTPYVESEKGRTYQNTTMMLNLRGDGCSCEQQIKLLSSLASGVVVFIEIESLENVSTQKMLKTLYSTSTTVIVMIDAYRKTTSYVKEFMIKYKAELEDNKNIQFVLFAINGKQKLLLEVKDIIVSKLTDFFKNKPEKALSHILEESQIVRDNKFGQTGKQATIEIRQLIDKFSDTISLKQEVLPLQGHTLHSISKNMKRLYKPSEYKTLQHKTELRHMISHLRIEQVKMMKDLHPLMCSFVKTILYYIQFDSKELINFAIWLKCYLEKLTREHIAASHVKYMTTLEKFHVAKQKNSNEVEGLKKDVDNNESDLLSASLGFEHFIREIAQVYEAILDHESRVSGETINNATWFPKVPANLLMAGLPFELMNGDLIHVPIVWVKAVLNELAALIGDKKCLIVSVVGIQSSGKSTLLNMMFGLQFPVGHGRITKGAFMQLIPVNDERLSFEIIVVIDTEGLRAPELGHENYQHDNEFATFIMGIADINIVNINGESQGEMNEVLQMVVHALLKMKTASDSLNLKQSCIFVHQNVKTDDGNNDALEYSLQRMINLLDEMTTEAADQLDISDIESFKQVIDFDKRHVWYLPNLYTGEHPITRVNPSYSRGIEKIKETILFEIATQRQAYFTLTDTNSRIEDIWNGILTEDFAFNFKNNLEAKAFTKLDSHYQELYWKLESAMYTFVRNKKFTLLKCRSELEFEKVTKTARNDLPEVLENEFERTKGDFDTFIEKNTLKNIMLKWKQGYTMKLQSSLQSISEKSDKQIQLIKDEIKQISDCERAIKDCEGEINIYASELANEFKDVTKAEVSTDVLRDRFEKGWISWRTKCSTTPINSPEEPEQVLDLVKKIVRMNILRQGNYHKKLDNLTLEECAQITRLRGLLTFKDIKMDTHINIKKSFITVCLNAEKRDICINQTVDFTDKLCIKIENYLAKLRFQDVRFNEIYISDILNLVEKEIDNHNQHKDHDYKFKLKLPYKAMVLTKIAAYCTNRFVDMNRQYDQRHNPQIKLEEYKDTAFKLFVDLVHKKTEDVIASNFFQEAIKSCILEQVEEEIPNKVKSEILNSFEYSKYEVMKSVMKDLVDKNSFDHFSVYITSPDSYVEIWLLNYTNTCLFQNNGHEVTSYALLSKSIVENALEDVNSAVNNATEIVKAKFGKRISAWLDEFMSSCKSLPLSKEKLSHVGKRNVTDIENFRRTVVEQLETTRKSVLQTVTETNIETVRWKTDPYTSIFKRLWGCCATCPFCSEPCQYNDGHLVNVKHSCRQHRPQGVGDYAWESGRGELVTDTCNFLIHESRKKFITSDSRRRYQHRYHKPKFIASDSGRQYQYRYYRTKFPEWEISPIYKPSKYWMWYFKTFKNQISEKSKTKVPEIPDEWYAVSAEDAKKSLNSIS